ncbi:MAG: biotin--[acetyl-CoA-carboxylase] ligase [Armatimonadota bacterium]
MADAPTMRGNWRVYHHATIDSTNLEALRLATREALPWTAVVADTQTEGRGRMGRAWLDRPRRCLLMTALIYPPPGVEGLLGAAMALAAVRALEDVGARDSAIKWPNDVMLGGRKVAGILAEGPVARLMAVGIGLNVNAPRASLSADLAHRATFLSDEIGRELELLPLADAVLAHFEREHFRLMSGEVAEMLEDVREFDCLSGREIRARSGGRLIEGRALGWTDDGRLAIIGTDGNEIALEAGEVTLS